MTDPRHDWLLPAPRCALLAIVTAGAVLSHGGVLLFRQAPDGPSG